MAVASFKVSVDRSLLKTMNGLGGMEEVAHGIDFHDLTSAHIEALVRSIVSKAAEKEVNPTVIQEALRGIRMPRSISDPEAGVLEYVHDVVDRLEGVGYGHLRVRNPEKTVKLTQEHVYPAHRKIAMTEHLEF